MFKLFLALMATQGIPNNSPISFKELFKLLSTKQSLLDKVVLSISFKSIFRLN